jgi:hypothetical protein
MGEVVELRGMGLPLSEDAFGDRVLRMLLFDAGTDALRRLHRWQSLDRDEGAASVLGTLSPPVGLSLNVAWSAVAEHLTNQGDSRRHPSGTQETLLLSCVVDALVESRIVV